MPVISPKQERLDAARELGEWFSSDPDIQRLAAGFEDFAVGVAAKVFSGRWGDPDTLLQQLEANLRFSFLVPPPERAVLDEGKFVADLALLVRRYAYLLSRREDLERVKRATHALARAVLEGSKHKLESNPTPYDHLHQVAQAAESDAPRGMTKKRVRSILARVAMKLDLMKPPARFEHLAPDEQDERLDKMVRDWGKTRGREV